MKKFILTVLGATLFSLGLGAVVENVNAGFKSDEKALDLIAKARQALGGDAAIAAIESMKISGRSTQTFDIDGQVRNEISDVEIALQFPNNLSRTYRIGDGTEKKEFRVVTLDSASDPAVFAHGVAAGSGEGSKVFTVRSTEGKIESLDPAVAAEIVAKAHADAAAGSGEKHEIRILKKEGDTIVTPAGTQVWVRKAETEAALAAGGEKEHRIILKKDDGTWHEMKGDGKNVVIATAPVAEMKARAMAESAIAASPVAVATGRSNEMLRTTLGLLLTAPKGIDVSYAFGGESIVDGTPCNIVVATSNGTSFKIFLSQATNLPVAMSFNRGVSPRVMFRRDMAAGTDGNLAGRPRRRRTTPAYR